LPRISLNDISPAVRAMVAEALGEIGDKRAIWPLMESLNDEDEVVRDSVRRALRSIQDK